MSTIIASDVHLHQTKPNGQATSNSLTSFANGCSMLNSANSILCCDHKQIIRNQLARIEALENELNAIKNERDSLLSENEKLLFQMQMSECYGSKRNFSDLQMNGVLQSELMHLTQNGNKNLSLSTADDKLTIEQIYSEPNNNNLSQICKQEQFRQLNDQQSSKLTTAQAKDQLDNAKIDEQMNLINNNLNTFNMLQANYAKTNDQSHYQTLYGHHRQVTSASSSGHLLNAPGANKTVQANAQLSSQLSQYELKPGQSIAQYELSQEMLDKRVELLMRKYGEKAWQSAMLIQRCWRNRQMSMRFHTLASGNQQMHHNGTTSSQSIKDNNELTSKSVNDLHLSGASSSKSTMNVTSSDQSQMDLMEVSNSEIIITDKTHPINNGNSAANTSQQKLINATLEALKTPLTDSQLSNTIATHTAITKSSMTNNRSIMKRYSNASLQSTSSSGSSSNSSMPRSPTMPALQKNLFYNAGSILSNNNCSTTPVNQHSASHILLNSSPLHPSGLLVANGQTAAQQSAHQLIYANGNSVCLTNSGVAGAGNSAALMNPYFKTSQTTPVLTTQHSMNSMVNVMSPAYLHQINQLNSGQLNGSAMSAMSLQSCLSSNLSRQSILSTLSNNSIMFAGSPQQQLHQQQLAKQQIQITQYETLRKRQYRIGLNLFNKRPPHRGIQYLIENGFIDVNLLNYAGFLIDSGLDSGLGSLASGSSNSISADKENANSGSNSDAPPERELQLAAAVARFLLTRKGLSKQMIGEYLGDLQKPFNQLVLKFFVKQMDLSGLLIDVALRKFQTFFRFPGEAQQIERLVEVFSEKYFQCNFENGINPSLYDAYTAAAVSSGRLNLDEEANPDKIGLRVMTKDEIFILSFAIIMLNTDLHIPNNKRRMTPEQWIKNLKGVFKEGGDLNEIFLLDVYERIKLNEFKTGHDHCNHVLKVQQTLVPSSSAKQIPNLCLTSYRRLVCFCRLYEIIDINKKTTKAGQHQREVFLFNDMLLVTKLAKSGTFTGASLTNNVAGGHSSSAATQNQYSYRRSILLSGCTVSLFSTNYYPYGIKLSSKAGNQSSSTNSSNSSSNSSSSTNSKCIIMFNSRNEIDRRKFYEDLKESIAEINEMEMIRISSTNGLTTLPSNLSSSSTSSSSSASSSISSSSNCTQQSKNSPTLQSKNPHSNSLLDLVKI